MPKLKIKDDRGAERVVDLANGVMLAGRASTNAILINDEKSSRQHFKIEHTGDGYIVADLDSTNGTRLNGTKIAEPALLQPGDVISVGKTTLTFDESDASKAELAATQEPVVEPEDSDRVTMVSMASSISEAVKAAAPRPASAGGPKYVIKVVEGANPGKIYELGVEALTLGRHASNTIQIDDDAASNYHAEITQENVGYVLSDLGSTNGTRVRMNDKTDFEKVVKTPLKPGMQIRVGKTLLDFENIGAPAEEDDPLFGPGAATLDPKKLDAKMDSVTAASGGGGAGLKIAALVAIVLMLGAAGFWFGPKLIGGNKDGTKPANTSVAKTYTNKVLNGDFEKGTNDEGYPEDFKVQKGWPEASIKVMSEGDSHGRVLQISKGGAKSLNRQTVVETSEPFPIDANKTYELSGAMKNDDDGLFGLRVTWVQGERSLVENPIVLKDKPEWTEGKTVTALTPPAWATHARVGVFVQGKSGKASFDDLSFKEKPGTPQPGGAVKFGGIELQFDGTKGSFSISSQGKPVAEDGSLLLSSAEAKAISDVASGLKPTQNKEEGKAGYDGRMYDFALQEFTNYSISAGQGAAGVDLRAAFPELTADTSSKPSLRFYLTGAVAQGDIELVKADGAVERIAANDNKEDKGYKSVLFNAGKTPQFAMSFAKPVELRLKGEGKKRQVEVRFDNEISIAMAPEDTEQKKAMLAEASELQKAVQAKQWGAAEAKAKTFVEKFGTRFEQAPKEAAKAKEAFDVAWKEAQDEHKRVMELLTKMDKDKLKPELLESARSGLARQTEAFKGSSSESVLADWEKEVKVYLDLLTDAEKEGKAAGFLKQAEDAYGKKNYAIALAWLEKVLQDKDLSVTKTADKCKELYEKAKKDQDEQDKKNAAADDILAKVSPLEKANKYKEALKIIENHPGYLKYGADLIEVEAKKKQIEKKIATQ